MLDTKRTRHKYYPLISMLIFQKDIGYQSQNYFACTVSMYVFVCVNVCTVNNDTYITSSVVRRPRSNDTRVPKGKPNTQILVSKYHSPINNLKKNKNKINKKLKLKKKEKEKQNLAPRRNGWHGDGTKKSWNTLYCQKVRNYTKNYADMSNEHKHQPEGKHTRQRWDS